MFENVTELNLILVALGCLLYSTSLHMKKPGQELVYGSMYGFAQNLTKRGRLCFFVGLIGSIMASTL